MNIVVDASVAAKWAFEEEFKDSALLLLHDDYKIIAPDFILFEISNVIWKKHRRNELLFDFVDETFQTINRSIGTYVTTFPLIATIRMLSFQLNHPIYDCIYIATAEHCGVPLVTADRRLYEKVAASPYAPLICWIENLPPVTAQGEK